MSLQILRGAKHKIRNDSTILGHMDRGMSKPIHKKRTPILKRDFINKGEYGPSVPVMKGQPEVVRGTRWKCL